MLKLLLSIPCKCASTPHTLVIAQYFSNCQTQDLQRRSLRGHELQASASALVCTQDWKTNKYQELIGSGEVPPRAGVLRLMDEARAAGMKVAVCSAATKSSVEFTLTSLLGKERFAALDCFMAGDDVAKKKPDPTIYRVAAGAHPRAGMIA